MSDSALQRLANRSPGISELTLPYSGNPKHISAKINDQMRLTFFQMTSPEPPKLYVPNPVGRNSGATASVAASIPPLFPGTARPVRLNAPMTYGRYAQDSRKGQASEQRDSHQQPAVRATPRATSKDPLSLLRSSFVDASAPVYTSAGTTLPTYTTLRPPPPLISAEQLAQLPLDLSTGATVVSSSIQRVHLHVPSSLMTQEINSILARVQTASTTASEL